MDTLLHTYRLKLILHKNILDLHELKSESDIKHIVESLVDIVWMIKHRKSGDVFQITKDVLVILKSLGDLSNETEKEILKDIFEYILSIIHPRIHS